MKIGLAQIDMIWEDKQASFEKCKDMILKAKQQETDFVIFPEMTLTGFSMNVESIAEDDNMTVEWFKKISLQYEIYTAFGCVENSENNKAQNNYYVISPKGEVVLNYTKIHPFSFAGEDNVFDAGSSIEACTVKDMTLSSFICYDLRFGEIFQIASKKAHLIIVAANWPEARSSHWKTLIRARAIENQCYIAGINCTGERNDIKYSGDSMLVDPKGNILVEANADEALFCYNIDVENVLEARNAFKVKADRKESLYIKKFLESNVNEESFYGKLHFKNRNVIVTGSCGLLGQQICNALSEFGANLILADVNNDSLKNQASLLKSKYGNRVLGVVTDICSQESVDNLISTALRNFGAIDGLVNSAYPRNSGYGTKFEDISLDSWKENIDMHLNGYFNITQKVSKVMIEQKQGAIVNLGSIYGMLGPDFSIYEGTQMTMPAEYSAIKGGIINFTKYLATYLAEQNIRVNCVSPGGIYNGQAQSFVRKYNEKTPLKRMGMPNEVAGAVMFLLSDMATYITGHNFVVDGGWSIW